MRHSIPLREPFRIVLMAGLSWRNYWVSQDEVLFFAETKNIADGKLYNQASGSSDYLTVTGAAGSYIFQCPNTAPYIAADTDFVWFRKNTSQRTPTEAELISYDFTRSIIKYNDSSPYAIKSIMILSFDYDTPKMRNNFWLSIWWDDTLSLYGHTKGNRLSEKSVWLNPTILSDGNTIAWWDAQDLDNITKNDETGEVTLWNSRLATGHNLIGSGAAGSYPIWSVDGILFDGVNDYLKTVAFNWDVYAVYIVVNWITWTSYDYLFDGDTDLVSYISQRDSAPIITYQGETKFYNSNMTLNTFHIIRLMVDSSEGLANTSLQVDATAASIGAKNHCTSNGFTLGCRGGLSGRFSHFQVQEIILRTAVETSENETIIYNYLKDKYGL